MHFFFVAERTRPGSLLPARLKFHERTKELPDRRDSGVPYQYQEGSLFPVAKLEQTMAEAKKMRGGWASAISPEDLLHSLQKARERKDGQHLQPSFS